VKTVENPEVIYFQLSHTLHLTVLVSVLRS